MEIVTQILAHEAIFAPELRQDKALVARLVEVLEKIKLATTTTNMSAVMAGFLMD